MKWYRMFDGKQDALIDGSVGSSGDVVDEPCAGQVRSPANRHEKEPRIPSPLSLDDAGDFADGGAKKVQRNQKKAGGSPV
jgi:hypothetical protein